MTTRKPKPPALLQHVGSRGDFGATLGDAYAWMRTLRSDGADVFMTDPPYEKEAHTKARRSLRHGEAKRGGRNTGQKGAELLPIDFAPMTKALRAEVATQAARIARKWVIVFCQVEAVYLWKRAFQRAGLRWVRGGAWIKPDGTPQFSGDRPGQGFECVAIAHRRGRTQWNGGGLPARWTHASARHENGGKMLHPTQKPLALMLELVDQFTNAGETIVDPFMGSGTTGVAAIRRGRYFAGCEALPHHHAAALERLEAESAGNTVAAMRMGQPSLFAPVIKFT